MRGVAGPQLSSTVRPLFHVPRMGGWPYRDDVDDQGYRTGPAGICPIPGVARRTHRDQQRSHTPLAKGSPIPVDSLGHEPRRPLGSFLRTGRLPTQPETRLCAWLGVLGRRLDRVHRGDPCPIFSSSQACSATARLRSVRALRVRSCCPRPRCIALP